MKKNLDIKMLVLLFTFVLFGNCFMNVSSAQKINQINETCFMIDEGQILYSPMWSTTTYLRESDGQLNHTWTSSFFPGVSVWWLGDGTILRTIRVGVGPGSGGTGGGVQKVEGDGTIVWDFRYNSDGVMSHHDVKTLPNGNVLLIAWETKTRTEAIDAGRNPNYLTNKGLWPDHIIEVEPTGPSSADIVWEWHVWDHLIQDYDPTKYNYGVIADHPELVDINYRTSSKEDLMHTNSIDYNEEFNQILISICNFNEIWVIDHSTTTEEAAGHTCGNSGMGGDILYRWGNPQTYDAGSSNDRKLFSQHDATWIKSGYPGEGNILVFNNGDNRPDGSYSSVDEIIPPVNENGEYYLEQGSAYGPEEQIWIYTGNPPQSFSVGHLSGAFRLSSGNTFITNGETGKLFEVTPEGSTVWQYNTGGQLFKAVYIPSEESPPPEESDLDCQGNINYNNIKSGSTINDTFIVMNIGGSNSSLNWEIESYPTWGTWSFNPEYGEGLTPEDDPLTVDVSVILPPETNKEYEGFIKVVNIDNLNDTDIIPIYIQTPRQKSIYQTFFTYLKNLYNLFPIIKYLLDL